MGILSRAAKALTIYAAGQGRMFLGWDGTVIGSTQGLPGERNYVRYVGDGKGTNLITAGVNWIMREFPAAPPALWQSTDATSVPTIVRKHELLRALHYPTADPSDKRMPRGYYSGRVLWQATAAEYITDGNAYWWKRRDSTGRVRQHWYLPTSCMDPWGPPNEGTDFISKYRYQVMGRTHEFDPWDIVHYRFGQDPNNPRKGLSPIRGLLRELYSDEEAARFTAAILHNLGMPGIVIIPGKDVIVDDEGSVEVKDRFKEEFDGDRRGEPIFLKANAEIKTIGWSPQELDLSRLRDVPEERVSAALGIPAAVLGWGTGLQQVKVGATMRELRAQAWEGAVLPMAASFAAEINTQLLHEYVTPADLDSYEFGFDFQRVPVMLDYHVRRIDAELKQLGAEAKMRSEVRAALGLPVDPERDNVFVPAKGGIVATETQPAEPTGEELPAEETPAA